MSERATVETLVTEARIQLRVKKDRVRALELVTAADAMLADTKVRADIYASVSSLWLDLGDEQRSEQRIVQAIEAEAQVTPARPVILGTHKLFYAKLLHAQQRFADAARHASEGLAIYTQGVEPNHPEFARLRADLAPILKHTPDRPSVAGALRTAGERLCAVVTGSEAEIHSALGIPTTPPPSGASECLVTAGELSRASVELRFPAGTLTRRELDETFGPATVLPRTGPLASHTLGYELRVPGAPARINLYARFATTPEPATSVTSVLLRIDPA
ncbi:hypothetical protein GCM10010399_73810 [Dactylosporangium fulvum]|uniref:Bacterial transcriptional activator domain-containing protein n=1 Tax=Dactylosporangium fulvum TaxID=53359 RepID=A0ABY5VS79_9ACTN|nr:hypothetical protein [Dactylosporangium fulvum]UWP79318.1 hypothetical protein Dfulv_29635 [Dactylosporangium fulvum]